MSSCPNSRRQSIVDSDTGAFAIVYKNCFGAGFNTVAILFITEIDNVFFAIGLPEKMRVRVEAEGHVDLGEQDLRRLARSKIIHVITIVISITTMVYMMGANSDASVAFLAFPF